MLKIKVEKSNFEGGLRYWKQKVKNTKLLSEYSKKKRYVKPSIKRKNKQIKANYKYKKRWEGD